MEDFTVTILKRWMQVLQEEWGKWVQDILRDTFDPAVVMQFLKSMGADISQFQGMMQSPNVSFDPYRILGLDKSARDGEVKKRYRELLWKLHPDTAGVEGTAFLLQMVLAAYEMIRKERGWQ